MSDTSIDALMSQQVHCYIMVSLEVLVLYEYGITFADEVRCVWNKKVFTAAAFLLLATRWTVVANVIFMAIPRNAENCRSLGIASVPFLLFGFIQLGLFSSLRVYAIWDRSFRWALVVLFLELVPVATSTWTAVASDYTYTGSPLFACTQTARYSIRQGEIATYVTRGCLIVSHTIVLVLTWLKTYSQWLAARRLKLNLSVSTCLLRDGTWFFLGALALNIAQVIASSVPSFQADMFVTTLPAVLFNRFMLNLRSIDDAAIHSTVDTERFSRFASPHFRIPESFLGNIGEPISAGKNENGGGAEGLSHMQLH